MFILAAIFATFITYIALEGIYQALGATLLWRGPIRYVASSLICGTIVATAVWLTDLTNTMGIGTVGRRRDMPYLIFGSALCLLVLKLFHPHEIQDKTDYSVALLIPTVATIASYAVFKTTY